MCLIVAIRAGRIPSESGVSAPLLITPSFSYALPKSHMFVCLMAIPTAEACHQPDLRPSNRPTAVLSRRAADSESTPSCHPTSVISQFAKGIESPHFYIGASLENEQFAIQLSLVDR
jgi:hypothetical protein